MIRRIFSYIGPYKKYGVLAAVCIVAETFFELIVPFIMADMVDVGVANGDKAYIFHRCLLLVLLAVVGLISAVSAQYFAAKSATGATTKLRSALFKKIQSLSFSQLDSIGSATLITRMTSDVNQIQTGINMFLRLLLRSPFIVIGATIMAFYVDVKGALVFAVVVPVLAIIVAVIMSLTIPRFKGVQNKLDSVLLRTKENVKGVRVIRAFTRDDKEISEFEEERNVNPIKSIKSTNIIVSNNKSGHSDSQIRRTDDYIILDVNDDIRFHSIYKAINAVAGTDYKGWMKACWPSTYGSDSSNFRIWFPKLAERKDGKEVAASFDCLNTLSEDWNEIIYDDLKERDFAENSQYEGYDLIFAKEPNGGDYIFRGVFIRNKEKSHLYHHVESRIATRVKMIGKPAHTIELLDDLENK